MKFLSLALFLSVLSFLSSCNKKQVEARREGLIPTRENYVRTFGLEHPQRPSSPTPASSR